MSELSVNLDFCDLYDLSDVHNELITDIVRKKLGHDVYYPAPITSSRPSIMVLPGDIWNLKNIERVVAWLEVVASRFTHVIYVMGNHEYYSAKLVTSLVKLKLATTHIANLHILENDSVVIDTPHGPYRFIGATLWTDFDNDPGIQSMISTRHYAGSIFNDFNKIRHGTRGYRRINTSDMRKLHADSRRFIFSEIKQAKALGEKVAVVSHHYPSLLSASQVSKFTPAYCSSLDEEIKDACPDFWFHGHDHCSSFYKIGSTWVINNPLGYYGEKNAQFVSSPVATLHASGVYFNEALLFGLKRGSRLNAPY